MFWHTYLFFAFNILSGFWNTLKTLKSQNHILYYATVNLFLLEDLVYCWRRMSWFLLLFDRHFSNYLQIPSKYSNTMFSICKVSLNKIRYGRILFLHNGLLLYTLKCKWNRETRHLLTKMSNLVQFNNKKQLLHIMKVKYNEETIKI